MTDRPRPTLRTLLDEVLPGATRAAILADDVTLTGVTSDSRRVVPGALFVVLRGTREDGARYAAQAAESGAAAIVAPEDAALPELDVPVVRIADTRGALALLAAAFHGRPSEDLTVVGVTGTNGKTTTTHLVDGILTAAGRGPCAVLGTIAYKWPGETRPAPNTTPGADDLQALLAEARDAGCRAAAIEVSSHALDQRRVEGVRFAGAVFTNLSGDHLDYHGSMDDYAEAKARLFRELNAGAVVAVNAEDPYAPTMLRDCHARVVRFGLDAPSAPEVTARGLRLTAEGAVFTLVTPEGEADVRTPLLGRYNVMNVLGAAGVAAGLGVPVDAIADGIAAVAGVRGRLEAVAAGQPFTILVDYAHTDDAVTNVLRNLRAVVPGRLISVVGCGGDRDRTKRPRMARAAAELSDLAWLTSDNPRSEEPQRIIDDMLGGIYGARNVRVEVDRRTAIAAAVAAAQVGDCVAILGKGHEDYQIVGDQRLPFDDREAAAEAVHALLRSGAEQESTR
jgi:UDP-N-acetylmuramoyl-L-alanyl-D-glutamate--2,6-diaminopimelate ligase